MSAFNENKLTRQLTRQLTESGENSFISLPLPDKYCLNSEFKSVSNLRLVKVGKNCCLFLVLGPCSLPAYSTVHAVQYRLD
jgi:hypothetical protein